MKHIRKF